MGIAGREADRHRDGWRSGPTAMAGRPEPPATGDGRCPRPGGDRRRDEGAAAMRGDGRRPRWGADGRRARVRDLGALRLPLRPHSFRCASPRHKPLRPIPPADHPHLRPMVLRQPQPACHRIRQTILRRTPPTAPLANHLLSVHSREMDTAGSSTRQTSGAPFCCPAFPRPRAPSPPAIDMSPLPAPPPPSTWPHKG